MKFSPAKFNKLLNGLAQSFLMKKGYACPCTTSSSGQPEVACPVCSGKGRFWSSDIQGLAGVVSREQMKKQVDLGLMDAGDIMLSIPSDSPLYAIGLYDRVATVNKTEPFSQNFVYNVNDKLKFFPTQIDRVVWRDATTKAIVDGTIPTINADGTLTWTGTAPPARATYSLTGRRYLEYFVYQDIPVDRPIHAGYTLPRRVILRRFDLFGN
jgi:hypothetical protein